MSVSSAALQPAPRSSRRRRTAILFLAPVCFAAAIDAFLIEPYRIEITRHHVSAPGIPPLKIAHLTDLHSGGLGRRERQLLSILEAERPDVIVLTGDTLKNGGDYEMCRELLVRLRAPLGVWAVRGNRETTWRPIKYERSFYPSVGVNLLVNESRPVRENVWMVGLDDPSSGSPDLDAALRAVPASAFIIALFHSPTYFDQVAGRCQLALAGHTHGGQVRIPFVPVFWLPRGAGKFLEGWYEKNGSQLYVSRGIGTSYLPVRFLCRPELAMVTLGE